MRKSRSTSKPKPVEGRWPTKSTDQDDHNVRRRLIPHPPLRQTRQTRPHHNSQILGILRDPEATNPGVLPHRAADTPGQADRAEPGGCRIAGREDASALPSTSSCPSAPALPEWLALPWIGDTLARQGSLRVAADLSCAAACSADFCPCADSPDRIRSPLINPTCPRGNLKD